MEYKALSQNTIKIVKEYTLNGSVDFSSPLHAICGNIKYTYGTNGTENQGISTLHPYNSYLSYAGATIGTTNGGSVGNQLLDNVIGYAIDGVTYYGIKNSYYQVTYSSTTYKFTFKGKLKVVKLNPNENAINVEEWDMSNISLSSSGGSPTIVIKVPKQNNDLILSITFEPSEE